MSDLAGRTGMVTGCRGKLCKRTLRPPVTGAASAAGMPNPFRR
jgi:hypothetical protein